MSYCPFCDPYHEIKDTVPSNIFTTKCGHNICFECFDEYILRIKKYPTPCFSCFEEIDDDDCEENLNDEVLFNFYETKSHFLHIKDPKRNKQCLDPDCTGLYIHNSDEELLKFECPICNQLSCLRCEAIHRKFQTCEDYENENLDEIKTKKFLAKENKRQIKARLSMECVKCKTMIQKLKGCDGVRCPFCTIGLCFKTRKARWGPNGEDDISDGCRCMWDGKTPCHPRCKGCFVHELVDTRKQVTYLDSVDRVMRTIEDSGQSLPNSILY